MNVFVLSTGRCGSTGFAKACQHIENFTSAQESRTRMLGDSRLDYPENHIEVDNRLTWFLGRLEKRYSDHALYVHLKRNVDATARSFTRRYSLGIIKAYRSGVLMEPTVGSDSMCVAVDYCHTVNSNIELFLKDKTQKMEIHIEKIARDFSAFWKWIDAKGDIGAALSEFDKHHNAS